MGFKFTALISVSVSVVTLFALTMGYPWPMLPSVISQVLYMSSALFLLLQAVSLS